MRVIQEIGKQDLLVLGQDLLTLKFVLLVQMEGPVMPVGRECSCLVHFVLEMITLIHKLVQYVVMEEFHTHAVLMIFLVSPTRLVILNQELNIGNFQVQLNTQEFSLDLRGVLLF